MWPTAGVIFLSNATGQAAWTLLLPHQPAAGDAHTRGVADAAGVPMQPVQAPLLRGIPMPGPRVGPGPHKPLGSWGGYDHVVARVDCRGGRKVAPRLGKLGLG